MRFGFLDVRECSISISEPKPSTLRLRKISSSIVEMSINGLADISSTDTGGGKLIGSGEFALNQGCSLICWIVMRFAGSTVSILLMRSCESLGRKAGIVKTPLFTFPKSFLMSSSSNGSFPVSKAYKITPQLQISAVIPLYCFPVTTSGLA